MSASLWVGVALGAGALSGWLAWALGRLRLHQATVAAAKAGDEATAAKKREAAAQSALDLAKHQIDGLLTDAAACADPIAVRDHLDRVLKDITAPPADGHRDPVPDNRPAPGSLIEGDLR